MLYRNSLYLKLQKRTETNEYWYGSQKFYSSRKHVGVDMGFWFLTFCNKEVSFIT